MQWYKMTPRESPNSKRCVICKRCRDNFKAVKIIADERQAYVCACCIEETGADVSRLRLQRVQCVRYGRVVLTYRLRRGPVGM
jgi:hypothetical protein